LEGNRTVQDFVEDMVSDCKSLAEILMVAMSTRWADHKEEIKKVYRELKINRKQNSKRGKK